MDVTLREYAAKADEIHKKLNTSDIISAKNYLLELEAYIRQIQSVSYKMALIYNTYKPEIKLSKHTNLIDDSDDNRPKASDHIHLLRETTPASPRYLAAPNIYINAQEVETLGHVPNTPIYWVKGIGQFAVKINNVMLRGNIGDIFRNLEYAHGYKKCKNANSCKYILKQRKCKYYHDLAAGLPKLMPTADPIGPVSVSVSVSVSASQNNEGKKRRRTRSGGNSSGETFPLPTLQYVRNFTSSSWMYTDEPKNAKNINMRHVGNRSSLSNDLEILKMDSNKHTEVDNYLSQGMHDLLVILCMGQYGLIPDAPIVSMRPKKYTGRSELILA